MVKNGWMEVMTLPLHLVGALAGLSVTENCQGRSADTIIVHPSRSMTLVNIAHSRKSFHLRLGAQIGR